MSGWGRSALKSFAVRYGLRLVLVRAYRIAHESRTRRKSLRTFAKIFLMCLRPQPDNSFFAKQKGFFQASQPGGDGLNVQGEDIASADIA
jgi:hypothetical protein